MQNEKQSNSKQAQGKGRSQSRAGSMSSQGDRSESQDFGGTTGSQAQGSQAQGSQSEQKSIGAVIGNSLAKGTQEKIDQTLGQFSGFYDSTKRYVNENPREAIMVGAAIGLGIWALLATKPGRVVFERGASVLVPELTKWWGENFSGGANGQQASNSRSVGGSASSQEELM